MSLHAQYRRDVNKVWVAPTAGIEMLVSYFDARQPEYINIMSRITKPVRKMVEQNLLKPDQDRKYAIQGFIEACMSDWRTVVTPASPGVDAVYRNEINVKGDVWLPFTRENAQEVFTTYPQFYLDTVDLARDLKSFQVTEDEVKN